MADKQVPKFANDAGVSEIFIGVKAFQCMGASAPFDHPHVYLDMGDETEIICPYCSTRYRYKETLRADESEPATALVAV